MAIVLKSKPGLSSTTTLNIPKDWDPTWFRNFINNQLKGADVRNAVGTNGISVTGNISSPYGTISIRSGPITIAAAASVSTLTVNMTSSTSVPGFLLTSTGIAYSAIESPSSASSAFLGFIQGAVLDGLIGADSGGSLVVGSSAGDIVIVADAANFRISTNNGAATALLINSSGSVIVSPTIGTALTVQSLAGSRTVVASLASTSSGAVAFTATDGGSTSNVFLETLTANFSSTGGTAAVLTGNKPGAGTAITAWIRATVNGVAGWIPFWAN